MKDVITLSNVAQLLDMCVGSPCPLCVGIIESCVRNSVTRNQIFRVQSANTGCPRRNVPDFGRVFLMLKYTDITQNTYIQS
jgi:hypothetical protein